jgi:uracil phosphoribosyltransferase
MTVTELHPNLVISPSKALIGLFTKLRDVKTDNVEFQFYAKRAMRILAEDAIAELCTNPVTIITPCGTYEGVESLSVHSCCAISILRAGDALLEAIRDCLPGLPVGKILIQRDEGSKDKEAQLHYVKLPKNIELIPHIILCDPMLATGGSAILAIKTLVDEYNVQANRIIFANMISCPEGLQALANQYPEVKVVTACVDECLNSEKYIVPGLGDYGDRFYNSS